MKVYKRTTAKQRKAKERANAKFLIINRIPDGISMKKAIRPRPGSIVTDNYGREYRTLSNGILVRR